MPDLEEPEDPIVRSVRVRRLKLTRIIAVASSSVLLACAGCCFLLGIIFRPEVLEGPDGANQIAAKITDWTLPEGFQGKLGIVVDFGLMRFEIAKFQQKEGRGTLVIGQWQPTMGMTAGQRLMRQYAPELRTINLEKPEIQTMTIRGWPGQFEVGHGEDLASNSRYQQASGNFRGKAGDVVVVLQCEEGILDDAAIEMFLKSIK
ncbi:hypothetical protein [Schlesneria paludicola]|uniref:hypothetical protein n=1 Tax=Schlesneria paludicola TaxID=360056 RepID=UPI00031BEDDF|nr:hypothetical protein [Schlesneria paludicola]